MSRRGGFDKPSLPYTHNLENPPHPTVNPNLQPNGKSQCLVGAGLTNHLCLTRITSKTRPAWAVNPNLQPNGKSLCLVGAGFSNHLSLNRITSQPPPRLGGKSQSTTQR